METKHTPGPWKWAGDNLESEAPEANYADVLTVEQLPRNAYPELQSGELVIENEADRALIAAAPELLTALEYVLNTHFATGNDGEDAAQNARALIAKLMRHN